MRSANLSSFLKNLRIQCGYTQQEVANHLGVSKTAIAQYESGRNKPNPAQIQVLAKLYGVLPSEIAWVIAEEQVGGFTVHDMINLRYKAESRLRSVTSELRVSTDVTFGYLDAAFSELQQIILKYCGKSFTKKFSSLSVERKERFGRDVSIVWKVNYEEANEEAKKASKS